MPTLIDTSVWVHFTRARSPRALKLLIAPYILSPDAVVAEPVMFEVLRHATQQEMGPLQAQLRTFPVLSTPVDLWQHAARLGQACRKAGATAGSLDLLIAAVALQHNAELITFDADFQFIARACRLRVKLLHRASA